MPTIILTSNQKAQLVGWLNREHDYSLSIKSMAERCILPGATGTLELIRENYEWIIRVRETIKQSRNTDTELSEQDLETLMEVARANTYSDRAELWKSVITSINEVGSIESELELFRDDRPDST